eukprot:CAMPEP_0116012916 /NCGR_PEP_ID=MMETSP0321-20121206/5410_1 /TAXON_ID=163516 /ORGANISM="Leptocylindrus danicus var. danicus, Strain B650" /LENGTH=306 /DNA_ID=CAMNT_0003482355 /DNA_START=484 /DNA_END=1405 /DNA_ORIENTATION=-
MPQRSTVLRPSTLIELFCATADDVAARHSKGAQKLHIGQVGIRCIFCHDLPVKERTERAVCYPSSIARIYQTVADMQRFHFESCPMVPHAVRETYRQLKTTRPRGMGSPQAYWIRSAGERGLYDTPEGIRLHLHYLRGRTDTDTKRLKRDSIHTFEYSSPHYPRRSGTVVSHSLSHSHGGATASRVIAPPVPESESVSVSCSAGRSIIVQQRQQQRQEQAVVLAGSSSPSSSISSHEQEQEQEQEQDDHQEEDDHNRCSTNSVCNKTIPAASSCEDANILLLLKNAPSNISASAASSLPMSMQVQI